MAEFSDSGTEVSIQPMGSYLEVDANGFLINPTGSEKIQKQWLPVIEEATNTYIRICGESLVAVFIRGSVAKGQAIDGISDLDTFAFVKSDDLARFEGFKYAEHTICAKFGFVEGVEFQVKDINQITQDGSLLVQSFQVFGETIEEIKMRPGKDMIRNAKGIFSRMTRGSEITAKLRVEGTEKQIQNHYVWFMKDIIRVGAEITYERSGRFTRDLYLCWKDFSEYYPDKSKLMERVLWLALNPTTNLDEVESVSAALVPFLENEAVSLGIVNIPATT